MEFDAPFIVLSMRTQCTFRWGIEMISNALRWAASTSLCLVLVVLAGVQSAEAQTKDFNVPAQSATTGIPEFARQAGIQILVSETLVRGKRTAAVTGALPVAKALAILLAGTGLTANSKDGATFTLSAPPTPSTSYNSLVPSSGSPATAENQGVPQNESRSSSSSATETADLAEIVVTGTNIMGVDNKTVPLLIFDRDAIERSGYSTTQDFIGSIPQNVKSGANSADGVLTGNGLGNIENSTAANLRGLGASSTLTLLNGHRVAPSSFGTGVDLSMIPLSAVERIEILTDGSSAVYGADAVGGVVNIILRKDFNGQEASARLDTLSRGGGEQKQIGQSFGRTWGTGGALLVLQFEDANAIHADQRAFTTNLPQPTDIYPSSKRYSGVFSGHQNLVDSLEVFADAIAERDDGFRAWTSGGNFSDVELLTNKTNSESANAGIRWQPFGDWHLEANALFSQVYTSTVEEFLPPAFGYTNGTPYIRNLSTYKEGDLKLDGTIWASGGASVKAAVGASYRQEVFSELIQYTSTDQTADRHVHAMFAEVYAPLISSTNAIPLVNKLEFSAAVRSDTYSDFGSKTNPRFGVFWSPLEQVGLRAAYSTSFRAPDPSEILSALTANNIFIESGYPLPNGATGNVIFFGNQTLGPESSRNLTAGLDFTPATLHGTRLSLNYYRIVYRNRLINSPTSAQDLFINPQVYGSLVKTFGSDADVAAFVAGLEPPQTLIDVTSGGTGLAGVRFGFPYGVINAARETTQGLDLGAHSLVSIGANKLTFDLSATYIKDIATTFCDVCATTDLVNTYGNPLKLRMRGSGGWSNGTWSANAAVNYSNAYDDTNEIPTGRISSYTTTDLNATYRIASSLPITLGLSISNAFNVGPPRTAPAFLGVEYDPSNADPRGRILSLLVRAQW
jgi:iron complex outermembrane receptor protein